MAKKKRKNVERTVIQADDVKPGMLVSVYKKIREVNTQGEMKERVQFFEGTVIARKGGKNKNATVMLRKISNGVGVEAIMPIYSPLITKIELLKEFKTRRSKLYFTRKPTVKLKEKKQA